MDLLIKDLKNLEKEVQSLLERELYKEILRILSEYIYIALNINLNEDIDYYLHGRALKELKFFIEGLNLNNSYKDINYLIKHVNTILEYNFPTDTYSNDVISLGKLAETYLDDYANTKLFADLEKYQSDNLHTNELKLFYIVKNFGSIFDDLGRETQAKNIKYGRKILCDFFMKFLEVITKKPKSDFAYRLFNVIDESKVVINEKYGVKDYLSLLFEIEVFKCFVKGFYAYLDPDDTYYIEREDLIKVIQQFSESGASELINSYDLWIEHDSNSALYTMNPDKPYPWRVMNS